MSVTAAGLLLESSLSLELSEASFIAPCGMSDLDHLVD